MIPKGPTAQGRHRVSALCTFFQKSKATEAPSLFKVSLPGLVR